MVLSSFVLVLQGACAWFSGDIGWCVLAQAMAAQKQQAMIAMAQQQAAMSARLAQQRDEQVPTVHTLQFQSHLIISFKVSRFQTNFHSRPPVLPTACIAFLV